MGTKFFQKSFVFSSFRPFVLLLILFLGFTVFNIQAQISTNELPYSWENGRGEVEMSAIPIINMPNLDLESLEREDMQNDNLGVTPHRFGYSNKVNITLENSGLWKTTKDGGRLWTLRIYSPDALSLDLLYDKFWLPEGAKFYIYSEDLTQHIGAFTSINNKGSKENLRGFATGFLFTNQIVLEYYESKEVKEKGVISISKIVSGYRFFNNKGKDYQLDYFCFENAISPLHTDWEVERNAVALIYKDGYICSGALLNTTANDFRPVFLTANHCFGIGDPDFDEWIFYWNFDGSPRAFSNIPDVNKSTTGASLLASNTNTDFMLLNLIEDPILNPQIKLHYLGWDKDTSNWIQPPGQGTKAIGIHHFRWKERIYSKAISKSWIGISKETMPHNEPMFVFPANTLWKVYYQEGAVYNGSSGSPLLNSNKRVLGQLWGGESICPDGLETQLNYYGILGVSWNGENSSNRLKDWLDPLNTNPPFIEGLQVCERFISQTIMSDTTIIGCEVLLAKDVNIIKDVNVELTASHLIILKQDFHSAQGSDVLIHIVDNAEKKPPLSDIQINEKKSSSFFDDNASNSEIQSIFHPQFTFHPNPNSGTFQIESNFSISDITSLKVIDMLGVSVYEAKGVSSNSIQLQNTAVGLYFVVAILSRSLTMI